MQIFVKLLTGENHTVDVDSTDTIKSVKEKIYSKTGLPPYQQKLTFTGKQLRDDDTLENYDITAECTIYLIAQLKGGRS